MRRHRPRCFDRTDHLFSPLPGQWVQSDVAWRYAHQWRGLLPHLELPAYLHNLTLHKYACAAHSSTSKYKWQSNDSSCALRRWLHPRADRLPPLLSGKRITILGDSTSGQLYVSLRVLTHGLNISLRLGRALPFVGNRSGMISWLRRSGARRSDADAVLINVGSWYALIPSHRTLAAVVRSHPISPRRRPRVALAQTPRGSFTATGCLAVARSHRVAL
jgi:hypothetical protein